MSAMFFHNLDLSLIISERSQLVWKIEIWTNDKFSKIPENLDKSLYVILQDSIKNSLSLKSDRSRNGSGNPDIFKKIQNLLSIQSNSESCLSQ